MHGGCRVAFGMAKSESEARGAPTPPCRTVYDLVPGVEYIVRTAFVDHYNNRFESGERLRFRERHFLPYHGGHTVVFESRSIYLQEVENAELVNNLSRFLEPV